MGYPPIRGRGRRAYPWAVNPRSPGTRDHLAHPGDPSVVTRFVRRPQVLLPAITVLAMLLFAVALQPRGGEATPAGPNSPSVSAAAAGSVEPTIQPTPTIAATAPASKTVTAAVTPGTTPADTAPPATSGAGSGGTPSTITADVAGARATTTAAADQQPDLTRESTQCGAIQEEAVALAVEQSIQGVGIRATKAAVYPIAYLRCILMATGGRDAISLSASLGKAERESDATHAALIDLWVSNAGRDFGQVNLKTASVAAAGLSFQPLATLGGRGEVVISSGEGRTVTIVVALKGAVGPTIGPMTVTVDAPLVGGKQTLGKYQLFLPTP
jgi:hypothetical protein